MIYCQACGAQNDRGQVACQGCGVVLAREGGGGPCRTCGEPVGTDDTFCAGCGTPVVGAAVGAADLAADAAEADPSAVPLGAGLELPEWLKRAAADTPPDAALPAAAMPAGFVVARAAPAANGRMAPVEALRAEATDAALPPLPPLPDGGLATTMPSWLRAAPDAAAAMVPVAEEPPPSAPPPSAGNSPLRPAAQSVSTSGMISENDLPQWIRQLVANEAAEAEAETQRVAEAAAEHRRVALEQVVVAAPISVPRRPIGNEPAAVKPWLASRDRGAADGTADEASAGRTSVFAQVMEKQTGGTGSLGRAIRPAADAVGSAVPPQPTVTPTVVPAARAGSSRRLVLMTAVLVLLLVLAAVYAMSAGVLG